MEVPKQDEIRHQKSRAPLPAKHMNLGNQLYKVKTTYNRNEKNANNGIRAATLFSGSESSDVVVMYLVMTVRGL